MPGAYCRYCDHRCFVERALPPESPMAHVTHLATCAAGKDHDRRATGGFDADSALNPRIPGQTQAGAYALAALAAAQEGEWDRARTLVEQITYPRDEAMKMPRFAGRCTSGIVYDLNAGRVPRLSVKKLLIALDDPRWERFAERHRDTPLTA